MHQDFGNFVEPDEAPEHLIIRFSPTSMPLQQRWRNNGLSADFVAEYWAAFFPAGDALSNQRRLQIKGAINYIANELLENVMKFSYRPADYAVDLKLFLFENQFQFYSCNAIDPQAVTEFQARIQQLLTGDPQELYMQQVERNAQNGGQDVSHLGLLTMMSDYEARLAWRFESNTEEPNLVVVTTMVQLDL